MRPRWQTASRSRPYPFSPDPAARRDSGHYDRDRDHRKKKRRSLLEDLFDF
jgi:Zn-finger nucleic acid-binding protein